MLDGNSSGQKFLRKSFENDRRKALKDRSKYTDSQLEYWGVYFPQGGGATNPDTWTIWQFPYPQDQSIRSKKKIDIRKYVNKLGEMSDV